MYDGPDEPDHRHGVSARMIGVAQRGASVRECLEGARRVGASSDSHAFWIDETADITR